MRPPAAYRQGLALIALALVLAGMGASWAGAHALDAVLQTILGVFGIAWLSLWAIELAARRRTRNTERS
jgi:hypothetical protein